ncbi:MAG: pre-16S rRNA-processing nuclease YqgF [Cyanobacteria bacterium J06600_6]
MNSNILGFDPGRDKCGVAVIDSKQKLLYHQVIDSEQAIFTIAQLVKQYVVNLIVMGDGTTSKTWQRQLESDLDLPIITINEANSTVEARDRYWIMYPPQGLKRLLPQSLRTPPRPVDDIVAILLIERYVKLQSSDC